MSDERAIDRARRLHESRLMAIPGVQGVAEGETATGEPAILVFVAGGTDVNRIPTTLEGMPVRTRSGDPFSAQ
ncbi:MAG: hypothetical protein IPM64_09715 [Phycisphaerales bacterium]|nr:hypothetical protein [Phycisphaerales bacterium]